MSIWKADIRRCAEDSRSGLEGDLRRCSTTKTPSDDGSRDKADISLNLLNFGIFKLSLLRYRAEQITASFVLETSI